MTVPFLRRRPAPAALRWVERTLGRGYRVAGWRRMQGGITSAVHRLTVVRNDDRRSVVLRQYPPEREDRATAQVEREVETLTALQKEDVRAPEALGADADGRAAGHPSVLMTRVPGRVDLRPRDPDRWIGQIARVAATIHGAPISAPGFESRPRPRDREPPETSSRPDLWRAAVDAVAQGSSATEAVFLHRDFQHFNFLWSRGELSGIVDWTYSSTGSAALDIGHCRLNLAVLFSAEWAEQLRFAYEAEAGRVVDPVWDLHALLAYSDAWRHFIPIQVAGRTRVDDAGMTARVETVIASTLARI